MAHVTTMVLKVDLQCHKCYKKVKDVLCRFDQIQNKVYDEKNNTVTIKVICCCPEKLKQKIIRKGKGVITCVETKKEPKKNQPSEKSNGNQGISEDKETKKEKPAKPLPPPQPVPVPAPVSVPVPVPCVPCVPVRPIPLLAGNLRRTCCNECYEGRIGGPCFHGHNFGGPPPCYQYDGYWGRPVCDSYDGGGSGKIYFSTYGDQYPNQEWRSDTTECRVM